MKRTIALLLYLSISSFNLNAQFNVTLNGKKINAGDKFNYADIKTLYVSFSNPEKLPPNVRGDMRFDCSIYDKNQKLITQVTKYIYGYAAVSIFLYPKTQKEYIVVPNKTPSEFRTYSSPDIQFSDVCNKLKTDMNADKVSVEFSLKFLQISYNSNGDQYYEPPIDVIEKFSFLMEIADKNTIVNCTSINASFKLGDLGEHNFKAIDSNSTWDKIKNLSTNNFPKKISFKFNDFYINVANLIYENNKTSAENLAEFKLLSDRLSYTQANLCNRNLDEKELLKLVDMGITSFYYFYNNTILERFDKKNNKNAENETIWESFKLNNVSGFRSVNTLKTNLCSERKPIYGGYGPADPSKRKLNGSSVVYVIINPTNPKSLLVFSYIQTEGKFDENLAKEKSIFMEKFLSLLDFKK